MVDSMRVSILCYACVEPTCECHSTGRREYRSLGGTTRIAHMRTMPCTVR